MRLGSRHFNYDLRTEKLMGITLILLLPSLAFGCSQPKAKPAQKLASEEADSIKVERLKDANLTLNNERVGSLSDLGPISKKIGSLMRSRNDSAVFREGTNEIANDVIVGINTKASLGQVGSLFVAIEENGGRVLISRLRRGAEREKPTRPNPLTLILSTGPYLESFPEDFRFEPRPQMDSWFLPSFRIPSHPEEIPASRVIFDTLEISADDKYFANRKVDVPPGAEQEDVKVDQKPVSDADLASTVEGIVPEGRQLTIIASENASYMSFLKVLKATGNRKIDYVVLIRRTQTK